MPNNYSGLKIAMFGACGTGKTTLALALSEKLQLPNVTNHARDIISRLDIQDVRDINSATTMALLEHALLLVRIKEQVKCYKTGFVSDRTLLDQAIYWYADCQQDYPKLTDNFVGTIIEYLKVNPYDLFVYVPVEFNLKTSDKLRYFDEHRYAEDAIASKLYEEQKNAGQIAEHFMRVTGSVQVRMNSITEYLETIV